MVLLWTKLSWYHTVSPGSETVAGNAEQDGRSSTLAAKGLLVPAALDFFV